MYKQLYDEYRTLYRYFGSGDNDVMKRLRELRREALAAPDRAAMHEMEAEAQPDTIERGALDE